jgi:hypothetical protein
MEELRWTIKEYVGVEVKRLPTVIVQPFNPHDEPNISKLEDLKEGDEVLIGTLFGWCQAKVTQVDYLFKVGRAESGELLLPLEFGQDDRYCWVCSSAINKKLLDKIKLW